LIGPEAPIRRVLESFRVESVLGFGSILIKELIRIAPKPRREGSPAFALSAFYLHF